MSHKPVSAEELKKRGYCCGMGCTNCPYIPRHQAGSIMTEIKEKRTMMFDSMVNLILEQLKIIAPAVKLSSGKVVPGKRGEMHAHVYDRIISRLASINNVPHKVAEKRFYKMMEQGQFTDGFVDSEGNFRTRQEAFQIAKGHIPSVAEMDRDLTQKGWKDEEKKMASEFIPGTRLHSAHA